MKTWNVRIHRGSLETPSCSRRHAGSINRNTRAVTMPDEEFPGLKP